MKRSSPNGRRPRRGRNAHWPDPRRRRRDTPSSRSSDSRRDGRLCRGMTESDRAGASSAGRGTPDRCAAPSRNPARSVYPRACRARPREPDCPPQPSFSPRARRHATRCPAAQFPTARAEQAQARSPFSALPPESERARCGSLAAGHPVNNSPRNTRSSSEMRRCCTAPRPRESLHESSCSWKPRALRWHGIPRDRKSPLRHAGRPDFGSARTLSTRAAMRCRCARAKRNAP